MKWSYTDGNDLSITTNPDGRIVYMEVDWGGKDSAAETGIQNFRFGETTQSEVRQRYGSNGFTFKYASPVSPAPGNQGMLQQNFYEIRGTVTMFIFLTDAINFKKAVDDPELVPKLAKLDSLAFVDATYAKEMWGDRILDPEYKPVQ